MSGDGYVKYSAEHIIAPPVEVPRWAELNEARSRLYHLGLVGSLPNGIGFGNLSIRYMGNEFLITGTGTGALPVLRPDGYCLVSSFDLEKNHVVSTGPVRSSSESMTHGAVYLSCPDVNCVIHIHSKTIFEGMIRDCFPATPKDAAYGTPEIAHAIGKCVHELGGDEGQIVMHGHEEGVITYGPTATRTFILTQELYYKYCC